VAKSIDDAKLSAFHFKAATTAGAGFFTDAYDLNVIGTVTLLATPVFHLNGGQISMLTSSTLLAVAIGAVAFGHLGDRLGRRRVYGLEAFARLLWQEWSPDWAFTDDEFAATADSFDNPDFVDVVVHSYRHRYGLVAGDPAYRELEDTIAAQPPILVPTVVIDPGRDGLVRFVPPRTAHEQHFPALLDVRVVQAGHNVPQEAPDAFADAILHAHRNC
jgi:pimeloyl-ACP methyl ester carboxylesterase